MLSRALALRLVAVVAAVALAGCGSSSSTSSSGPSSDQGGESPAAAARAGGQAACSYSADYLAKQYGTSSDPTEIAQAYASGLSDDPAIREAAIQGCMDAIK